MNGKIWAAKPPPGHHATPAKEWALFIQSLRLPQGMPKKKRGGKILIVDWDAHHGNGTQDFLRG